MRQYVWRDRGSAEDACVMATAHDECLADALAKTKQPAKSYCPTSQRRHNYNTFMALPQHYFSARAVLLARIDRARRPVEASGNRPYRSMTGVFACVAAMLWRMRSNLSHDQLRRRRVFAWLYLRF